MPGGDIVVNEPDVLTMAEAIAFLRFKTRKAVLRAVREQKLPGKKIGCQWRFQRKSLERWLEGGGIR